VTFQQDARQAFRELQRVNDRLSYPDDTPLWVEVLGAVCVIGFVARTGVHVWTAIGVREHLDPEFDVSVVSPDVTLASPCRGVREHLRADITARYLTFVVGLAGYHLFAGIDRPHVLQDAFLYVNLAVCLGDPLAFAITKLRARSQLLATTRATTDHEHHDNDDS